jgi:hypothetical protein
MHQIYSRATNILVWLGPEENHSDLALTLIKEAGASHAIGTTFTELINTAPDLQRTALDNLLKRQYWHRVWIIQEIGLARHIKVHCGRLSIDWFYVALFFFRLQNLGRRVDGSFLQDIRSSMPANLQPIWRFCHQSSINITLRSLLGASLHSVCQDPRDKIYGLLALVRKGVKTRILIDYKKTLAEVLSDMVISMEPDSRDEVLQGRFQDYGRYTDYNAVYLDSYLLSFMCAFHKSLRSIIQAKPPEELLSPTMREMLDFSFAECHPGKWIPAIRLGKILKLMPADVQSREEQRVFSISSTLCYGFHTIKKCSTCQAKPSDQRCLHKNDYRRYQGPKETGVVKTSVKSTFLQEDRRSLMHQSCQIVPHVDAFGDRHSDASWHECKCLVPYESQVGDEVWRCDDSSSELYLVVRCLPHDDGLFSLVGRAIVCPSHSDGGSSEPGRYLGSQELYLTATVIQLLTHV